MAVVTLLALMFSGSVQAWIAPPSSFVWLHPIAWVPAFAVFARLDGRRAFFAGWLVGTSANLTIFSWLAATVTRYGGLPLPVAMLVLLLFAATSGLYAGIFAWGFGPIRRVAGAGWPFAIAIWFCAVEFLNPQIFGYLQGVAWYQHPRIFLITAFGGVTAMSFLVILANTSLLQGLEVARARAPHARAHRRPWAINATVAAALALAAVAYSGARLEQIAEIESNTPPLRAAIIQPNHTIERRHQLARAGVEAFAADLIEQSLEAIDEARARGGLDVLVWPEGALRADPLDSRHRPVRALARERGIEIWTGANHRASDADGGRIAHNSAFRIDRYGKVDRRYDKNILVPFGEYVPLADRIPALDAIPAVARFDAGVDTPTYTTEETKFVFLICYEAIRSGYVRAAISGGANLMVNVTVDAWYGDSAEQSQHLMLAAIQSALHGIPMLRATTTGISAVVDARGQITSRTGVFTRESLVTEARPMRLPGSYTRKGEWLAWGSVMASAALLLASLLRQRSSKSG
jgi:apolipoprotein N-acyltransferase